MDPIDNWRGLLSSPCDPQPRERCYKAAKASKSLLQRMSLLHKLETHRGCVNTITWNESGRYILSGSDDHRLIVTEPYTKRVMVDLLTSHRANIFSAKFLPGTSDKKIVSCAGDGTLLFTDLERTVETHGCTFTCHSGTSYELLTVQGDPNSFLSCGEDGTVRWFDLRTKENCHKTDCKDDILISLNNAVTSMSLNPLMPFYLAVGSSDASVRIFDRRMLHSKPRGCMGALVSRFLLPEMVGKRRRITSIDYRPDGEEVLVSFSSDYIYTFNPRTEDPKRAKRLYVGRPPQGANTSGRVRERSPPPMKRLRLRGDWSDTGPNARPETQFDAEARDQEPAQMPENPSPANLMQRMTDALSRMLNDPSTRNAVRTARAESQAAESQQEQAGEESGTEELRTEATGTQERSVDTQRREGSSESNQIENSTSEISDQASGGDHDSVSDVVSTTGGGHDLISDITSTISLPVDTTGRISPKGDTTGRMSSNDNLTTLSDDATARSIDTLQESITNLREEFIDRHNEEPNVNLSLRSQGVESSVITLQSSRINPEPNVDSPERNQASRLSPEPEHSDSESALTHPFDIEVHRTSRISLEPFETTSAGRRASHSLQLITEEDEPVEDPSTNEQVNLAEDHPLNTSTTEAEGDQVPERLIFSPPLIRNLPGPSQVVTHPGTSGIDSHGQRQRRRGVSGPPTGTIEFPSGMSGMANFTSINDRGSELDDIQEYEVDSDTDLEEGRRVLQPERIQKFTGHRNARTMIKEAAWWGNDYILSGSDCGHIFGWDRKSEKLVLLLEADRHVVNCVQAHPFDPVLISSGIDYNVKVWTPNKEEAEFDEENAQTLCNRNQVMLEETMDTITVPATLMIRMLASLNQIRRAGRLVPRTVERRDILRDRVDLNSAETVDRNSVENANRNLTENAEDERNEDSEDGL